MALRETIHACLQAAAIKKIHDPSFQIELPKLSSTPSKWQDPELDNVLEFAGDNLMYSCVSEALLKMYPSERRAGPFSVISQVVTTNETFYHCMLKAGASTQVTFSKEIANDFEILMGAYKMETSFDVLCDWVFVAFGPIITACEEARYRYCDSKRPREDETGDMPVAKKHKNAKGRASDTAVSDGEWLPNRRIRKIPQRLRPSKKEHRKSNHPPNATLGSVLAPFKSSNLVASQNPMSGFSFSALSVPLSDHTTPPACVDSTQSVYSILSRLSSQARILNASLSATQLTESSSRVAQSSASTNIFATLVRSVHLASSHGFEISASDKINLGMNEEVGLHGGSFE
ncbi:hypothetical protein FIBSPDRAFT_1049178 [Athelia psychrophila]|uniref:RNase III domain-containing protein n=1 Tax=Athelia psychrophila TaxID=1759441 RepID=A0A166CLT5_9AGAM|nr:hypothetical protein FIBSPDRAFT_1049178 [Fibularhizoctonia sp. CBS 109695]